MKSKIPISVTHPNLLNEWDYDLNEIRPDQLTYGSSKKVFWKCHLNHSWPASIQSRTYRGSGCPFCRSQTSLNELFIFSELSYIFSNAIHRYIRNKKEIDVFLPDINIGIEYDGFRWHKTNDIKDKNKNLFFKRIGIKIIRIRQKGLPKLAVDDIITEKKINAKALIDEVLENILKSGRANKYKSKIIKYLKLVGVANDSKYQDLLAYHPFPYKGKSLEDKFPKLSLEWNILKNKNLTPNHFYPQSATEVWWKCSKGHEWKSVIYHRVNGSGCPYCSGRVAGQDNNLAIINKDLANEWNYEQNNLTPVAYLPNSGKKVWWKCFDGHEWQATIASRNSGKSGCPYCSGQRVLEYKSIF